MRSPFLVLIALAVSLPALAGIYKWTDGKGKVHYSDQPPSSSKTEKLRLTVPSFGGPAKVTRMAGAARKAGACGVRIFTTSTCGYCRQAKSFLGARGVAFNELNVESEGPALDEFRSLGGHGVPVILVGDARMDGFNAGTLDSLLNQAGC